MYQTHESEVGAYPISTFLETKKRGRILNNVVGDFWRPDNFFSKVLIYTLKAFFTRSENIAWELQSIRSKSLHKHQKWGP